MVVLEQGQEAQSLYKLVHRLGDMGCILNEYLCILRAAQAFTKGSSSELMFLPRPREVSGICRCGRVAHVLLGSDKGRRLHSRPGPSFSCRKSLYPRVVVLQGLVVTVGRDALVRRNGPVGTTHDDDHTLSCGTCRVAQQG